jgi:hypothetical protein
MWQMIYLDYITGWGAVKGLSGSFHFRWDGDEKWFGDELDSFGRVESEVAQPSGDSGIAG